MQSETWLDIFLNPSHIIAELLWNLVFDVILISLGYGVVIKKIVMPYLKRTIHKHIDTKHGIQHKESEY